jgi:hypothetical protein
VEVSGQLHASAGETASGTHWIGGLVGPRADLIAIEKRTISCPYRQSIPGRRACSPSLYRLRCSSLPIIGSKLFVSRKFNPSRRIFSRHHLFVFITSAHANGSHHFLEKLFYRPNFHYIKLRAGGGGNPSLRLTCESFTWSWPPGCRCSLCKVMPRERTSTGYLW